MATIKSKWLLNKEPSKWSKSLGGSYAATLSGKIGDVTFSQIKGKNPGGSNEYLEFYTTTSDAAPTCRLYTPFAKALGINSYAIYKLSSDWVSVPFADINATDYNKWRVLEFYDDIPTLLRNYLTANATQIIETTPTTITYNGTELASLEEGQTANFDCEGTRAKTNVSILFGSKGSITYKGVTTEIEAGKTATLLCAGKKFATEVVVAIS